MFKQSGIALALALGVISAPSFAATTSANFNVNVALTSACEFTSGGAATSSITGINLTYTSFQTTASTGSTSFAVRCSSGTGYALDLDATSGSQGGLNYTLNLGTSATSGTNKTVSGQTGAGTTAATYYVQATIAKDQAGTNNSGSANTSDTTVQHSVTITY